MANQSAKKRKVENARILSDLRCLIFASSVFYSMIICFHSLNSSNTWKYWIGLVVTSLASIIPYLKLASMAQPTYADNGELIDGGSDVSNEGFCGYFHDIILITVFVQFTCGISDMFWYTYLLIPGYAIYQASGFIKEFLSRGFEIPGYAIYHASGFIKSFSTRASEILGYAAYQALGFIKCSFSHNSEEMEDEKTSKKRKRKKKTSRRRSY